MKKLTLLFAFMAISLVSCNGDDDTTPVTEEKVLLKTVDSVYAGENLAHYWITDFNNNKMLQKSRYSPDGSLQNKTEYSYNSNGLLSLEKGYVYPSDIGEFQTGEISYEYDSQDRLTSMLVSMWDFEGTESSIEESFVYNNDNTITRTRIQGEQISVLTYYLDGQGRVFKHGADGQFKEVEYEGNDVITISDFLGQVTNYTYDDEPEVKGHYLNSFVNQFGSYAPNVVLVWDFEALTQGIDRFRVSQGGEVTSSSEYTYDEDGYPIGRAMYGTWSDTVPVWTTEITYE